MGDIKDRLLEVRTTLGLSQEAFGERLEMTRSAISKLEQGWATLTEKNLMLICQKFGVNREWLAEGKGEMFDFSKATAADSVIALLDIVDPLDVEIIRAYLQLDEKYRAAFRELLKDLIGR